MRLRFPGDLRVSPRRRVPVFMHWSAYALAPALMLALMWRQPLLGGFAVVCYFVLILGHELGHAAVAHRFGLRTHEIRLFIFHGLCRFDAPDRELAGIAVAWGGVAVQALLLASALCVAWLLPDPPTWLAGYRNVALAIFVGLNGLMLVQNLVPARPLDGALAWRIVPYALGRFRRRQRHTAGENRQAGRGKVVDLRDARNQRRPSRPD